MCALPQTARERGAKHPLGTPTRPSTDLGTRRRTHKDVASLRCGTTLWFPARHVSLEARLWNATLARAAEPPAMCSAPPHKTCESSPQLVLGQDALVRLGVLRADNAQYWFEDSVELVKLSATGLLAVFLISMKLSSQSESSEPKKPTHLSGRFRRQSSTISTFVWCLVSINSVRAVRHPCGLSTVRGHLGITFDDHQSDDLHRICHCSDLLC